MIYIITRAYNAEKTLRRAIESVLSQTYENFKYHLCNNGSDDLTNEIIREYAEKDSRIRPVHQRPNAPYNYDETGIWSRDYERKIERIMFYLDPDDWYVHLDADDDYSPDFLEKMLRFAKEENLELVSCRSNYIREPAGEICNKFVLDHNIILDGEKFGTQFPQYYRFMGSQWAKLHKGSIFHRIDRDAFEKYISSLSLKKRLDTVIELYYLQHSQRAGVLAEALHNYHLYDSSTARSRLEEYAIENNKMPDIYRTFLRSKVGYVSEENEKCIMELYNRFEKRIKENGGME